MTHNVLKAICLFIFLISVPTFATTDDHIWSHSSNVKEDKALYNQCIAGDTESCEKLSTRCDEGTKERFACGLLGVAYSNPKSKVRHGRSALWMMVSGCSKQAPFACVAAVAHLTRERDDDPFSERVLEFMNNVNKEIDAVGELDRFCKNENDASACFRVGQYHFWVGKAEKKTLKRYWNYLNLACKADPDNYLEACVDVAWMGDALNDTDTGIAAVSDFCLKKKSANACWIAGTYYWHDYQASEPGSEEETKNRELAKKLLDIGAAIAPKDNFLFHKLQSVRLLNSYGLIRGFPSSRPSAHKAGLKFKNPKEAKSGLEKLDSDCLKGDKPDSGVSCLLSGIVRQWAAYDDKAPDAFKPTSPSVEDLLKQGCKIQNASTQINCLHLAYLYKNGTFGIDSDPEKAKELFGDADEHLSEEIYHFFMPTNTFEIFGLKSLEYFKERSSKNR